MLPWENNFGAKFMAMVFEEKIFWVVHEFVNPRVF